MVTTTSPAVPVRFPRTTLRLPDVWFPALTMPPVISSVPAPERRCPLQVFPTMKVSPEFDHPAGFDFHSATAVDVDRGWCPWS